MKDNEAERPAMPDLIELSADGLTIDGKPFPWFVSLDPPPAITGGFEGADLPTVTVTILARRVTADFDFGKARE